MCHYECLPAEELIGIPWCCSNACHQLALASILQGFVAEIEPLQKAAARKKRRLASEMSSLQITARDYGESSSRRVSTRGGRVTSGHDYSFRDYDRAISDAIRKSERKSADAYSSEEEIASHREVSRNLSREERMAMRNKRFEETYPVKTDSVDDETKSDFPVFEAHAFEMKMEPPTGEGLTGGEHRGYEAERILKQADAADLHVQTAYHPQQSIESIKPDEHAMEVSGIEDNPEKVVSETTNHNFSDIQ